MFMSLKKSYDSGMEKVRWFSSLLSERVKVELAVVKLLRESDDLEKRRKELIQSVGERVFELRGRRELDILGDSNIREILKELEAVDEVIEQLKSKVSEIGKAE